MYPEITPLVRDAVKRRYELIPYIYSLALESHLTANPPQRWVGWGYEADPNVWKDELKNGETQYWLGDSLLVGGIYEPGIDIAKMYLPRVKEGDEDAFINLNEPNQFLNAGQWIELKSPWKSSIAVIAKVGGAIPVGRPFQTLAPGEDKAAWPSLPEDDYRGVEIFPPKGDSNGKIHHNAWYEDDGISAGDNMTKFVVSYSATTEEVMVDFERERGRTHQPRWDHLCVILPVGDEREVIHKGKALEPVIQERSRGRKIYRLHESVESGS